MPIYKAPLEDVGFLLNDVFQIDRYDNLPGFSDASADVREAVLAEAAKLSEQVLQPLNRTGDLEGCTRHDDGSVATPKGFKEAFKQVAEGGWLGLSAPVEYGGQGLPVTLSQTVTEFQSSANMAFSMYGGLTMGATAALIVHGKPEQKAMFVPKMVAGEWTGTMNLTEPQCGTDLGLLRTKAVKQADGSYKITGTKIFISAGEHEMDDVFGEIVLTGGNENLGARDLVTAVGLLDGLGAQQAQIRAALRFGEIHGAGPFTGNHLRHEHLLLLGFAMHDQRRGRPHRQAAIHGERHIRRRLEFCDGLHQGHRQSLSAIFRRRREPEPTAFDDLLERLFESLRRGHAAVVMTNTALEIADAVERLQDFFAELGGLAQNSFANIGRRIAKSGEIVVTVDLEDVVEQEIDVFQRGFVDRHGVLPARSWRCFLSVTGSGP